MKAMVWTKYGPPDGLKLQEVAKPVPTQDEILIKIVAATVTAGDCEMRRLQLPLGLSFPMRLYAGLLKPERIPVLGQELAGVVEQVGENVTTFQVGDAVFGTTGFKFGAYAEYICLPGMPGDAQGTLAVKPENLSFEEAAAVPTAGLEALHFMQAANIQPGKSVLVVGGGGSIGTFSIQLARYLGAEVIGVDSSDKLELMASLGANHLIDYSQSDYTQSAERYDLIIDVVGRQGVRQRLNLLKPDGVYFLAYARVSDIFFIIRNKQLKIESSAQKKEDLEFLAELLEAGQLRSVIDRRFPLEEVASAHEYAESGRKRGNIAVIVSEGIG